ncbi:MAG TPA: MCE family protein [Gammaproteobacteria bacterium]|nr:MCE family protein [Gammaproteobacteria bacterium]
MSQKVSATAIGAFVLGAIALLIIALLTFGSGKFLKDTETYVLYFKGNAKGLNIGAPASFRGVKIGVVTDVQLLFDRSTDEVYVAVVVELAEDAFHSIESRSGVNKAADKNEISYVIEKLGLRAKLASLSLVTGQLYVDFNFYPDTPVRLYGFDFAHKEFPTLPSTMEELQDSLQELLKTARDLPLRKLVGQLSSAIESISSVANSQAFRDTPGLLNQALVNLRDLSARLNEEVTPLTRSLQQTSDEAGAAIADLRIMMRREEGEEVVRLAESIEAAANQADSLLKQSRGVVSSIDANALESLVQELSRAARSIRVFADYLERHPEALIRGKNP